MRTLPLASTAAVCILYLPPSPRLAQDFACRSRQKVFLLVPPCTSLYRPKNILEQKIVHISLCSNHFLLLLLCCWVIRWRHVANQPKEDPVVCVRVCVAMCVPRQREL